MSNKQAIRNFINMVLMKMKFDEKFDIDEFMSMLTIAIENQSIELLIQCMTFLDNFLPGYVKENFFASPVFICMLIDRMGKNDTQDDQIEFIEAAKKYGFDTYLQEYESWCADDLDCQ